MFLYSTFRGKKIKKTSFLIWRDDDILILNKNSDKFMKEYICEMLEDDDVETDEEIMCTGIQQCHSDLR